MRKVLFSCTDSHRYDGVVPALRLTERDGRSRPRRREAAPFRDLAAQAKTVPDIEGVHPRVGAKRSQRTGNLRVRSVGEGEERGFDALVGGCHRAAGADGHNTLEIAQKDDAVVGHTHTANLCVADAMHGDCRE